MKKKDMIPCRICGELFEPCFSCQSDRTAFHWKNVACSYEHGKEFLKREFEKNNVVDNKVDVQSTECETIEDQEVAITTSTNKPTIKRKKFVADSVL